MDYNVEGMNKHIVEANIKLQDENKMLKEDMERIQIRFKRALKYIESHKENIQWIECFGNDLKDILEGKYIEEI